MGALALTFAMYGSPAMAGCSDPRVPGESTGIQHLFERSSASLEGGRPENHSIVGTWQVTYTLAGSPWAEAFIQWHSDGTEWEDANFPILSGNVCVGSWKAVSANTFARNHYGWTYDGGTLSGYFNETETDVLSKNGNAYSGNNETKLYDLSGNMIADVAGTSSAVRIEP